MHRHPGRYRKYRHRRERPVAPGARQVIHADELVNAARDRYGVGYYHAVGISKAGSTESLGNQVGWDSRCGFSAASGYFYAVHTVGRGSSGACSKVRRIVQSRSPPRRWATGCCPPVRALASIAPAPSRRGGIPWQAAWPPTETVEELLH